LNRKERQSSEFRIEPLAIEHERQGFLCGVEALDRYIRTQASQDVRRHAAAVFVITTDGKAIAGFYTLSAHMVKLDDVPTALAKQLARYPSMPATLLGRLAVSVAHRGQGIGQLLLFDALRRALLNTSQIASSAVVVDAKDEAARSFYLHHEFIPLATQPNRLIYPMKSIERLFVPRQV
jgi:predicted GNAT family N-acyltransferase